MLVYLPGKSPFEVIKRHMTIDRNHIIGSSIHIQGEKNEPLLEFVRHWLQNYKLFIFQKSLLNYATFLF